MMNICNEPIRWILSGCSQTVHFLLGPPQFMHEKKNHATFQCVTLSKTWKLEIECWNFFVAYKLPCTIFSNPCWFEQSEKWNPV